MINKNNSLKFFQAGLLSAGRGLLAAWWLLWLLELLRPGLVSLYLDLNLILVLALVAWFIGRGESVSNRWLRYSFILLSVIIIIVWLIRHF